LDSRDCGEGLIEVVFGALLNRRNEKQAGADGLLVSAPNDAMITMAEASQGSSREGHDTLSLRDGKDRAPAFRRFQDLGQHRHR
jgi:hypothetical protein